MEKITKKTTGVSKGLIIGKFMPPHLGHKYLIDFAREYVDELTVIVCSIPSEPIPGELRFEWMKEMFPDVSILHHGEDIPQEPKDHPDFWDIWHDTIFKYLPDGADFLFASEDYGFKLAEVLDMDYIPVDHGRTIVPISGTEIRKEPLKNWDYLPSVVRPYFVKKVCITGPESSGKTTLTHDLAKHYKTVFVDEWARGLLDFKDGKCDPEDIEKIGKGHPASEDAMALQANRVVFSDTDLIITKMWSEFLFDECPQWIIEKGNEREYDLYLLTDIDTPWVEDPQRYQPEVKERQEFLDNLKKELDSRGRKYVLISGSWEERFKKAVKEVDKLLGLGE